MHLLLAVPLLLLRAACPAEQAVSPTLPLALELPGGHATAYVDVPLQAPAPFPCEDPPPPPRDVLHGEPGDLLRGPGTPRVRVEQLR